MVVIFTFLTHKKGQLHTNSTRTASAYASVRQYGFKWVSWFHHYKYNRSIERDAARMCSSDQLHVVLGHEDDSSRLVWKLKTSGKSATKSPHARVGNSRSCGGPSSSKRDARESTSSGGRGGQISESPLDLSFHPRFSSLTTLWHTLRSRNPWAN